MHLVFIHFFITIEIFFLNEHLHNYNNYYAVHVCFLGLAAVEQQCEVKISSGTSLWCDRPLAIPALATAWIQDALKFCRYLSSLQNSKLLS